MCFVTGKCEGAGNLCGGVAAVRVGVQEPPAAGAVICNFLRNRATRQEAKPVSWRRDGNEGEERG